MTNTQDKRGKKIGEDKHTEHWSLDGRSYVEVPKWVIAEVERETKETTARVVGLAGANKISRLEPDPDGKCGHGWTGTTWVSQNDLILFLTGRYHGDYMEELTNDHTLKTNTTL
jgi:hypothetical protein